MEKQIKSLKIKIDRTDIDRIRIDKFIAEELQLFTRSQIKNRKVRAILNGSPAKMSKRISTGDALEIRYSEPEPTKILPEPIELDIVYENNDIIVVNKPQGMVVHPANGNYSGTLVQALLYHCGELAESFKGELIRPGIIHRLDKDTSGLIIAAKHQAALEFVASQFRKKTVQKTYLAVVKGALKPSSGTVRHKIVRDNKNRKRFTCSMANGKPAVTGYKTLKRYGNYSFVVLYPATGRTHQLRVHMLASGCPILGDSVYSQKDSLFPDACLLLHAYTLKLTIPGEDKPRFFRAPLPERFKAVLRRLAQLETV
ncbi:MAG: RluA family pseudouridine synthase [Spirochaetota bacterium]